MSGRIKSDDKQTGKVDEIRRSRRESSRSRRSYIEFEEQNTNHFKSPSRNKSPSKNKSPSRKKSPSRNKSPARIKSSIETQKELKKNQVKAPKRSPRKSPSRKSPVRKSPIRKSPSRQSPGRKSPSRISPARLYVQDDDIKVNKNVQMSTSIFDINRDSDFDIKSLKPTVRSRIGKLRLESTPVKDIELQQSTARQFYNLTKRSNILPNTCQTERIVHLKNDILCQQEKTLTEFSDEDEIPQHNKPIDSIESRYQTVFVTEFGGWFGALFFIIALPLFAIGLHIFCNSRQCTYQLPNITSYKNLSTYLNVAAFLSFFGYMILLMLLAVFPYGGRKVHGILSKCGRSSYVANGWISVLFMHLLLLGLELYGIKAVNHIYDMYFQIAVAAVIHGILFSVYLNIRSFFVPISALNPNGDTNSFVYNFFVGRETNPSILEIINVKIYLLRMTFVTAIVISTAIILKNFDISLLLTNLDEQIDIIRLNFNPTRFVFTLMWYIYFFDGILLEKTWATTFEMQYQGVGYLTCLWYFTAPFLYGTIIKYVYDYNVQLSNWSLIMAFSQFLLGYIIYRGSNNQKDAFRNNPYSPSVAHLEAIPTAQGKKLIISGLWGFVRHPNYLGTIIIHFSFLYFVINAPPTLVCIMVLPTLIYRAKRDGFRCKCKYEAAWDRYCQRVKYVLIPKVY